MHAHACSPLRVGMRREFDSRNLATALLEGTVQVIESALKARGGEIPAVGGVPCTAGPSSAMSAETVVRPFFHKSGVDVHILAGQNGTETCGRGQTLLRCRFCFIEARPLIFDGHFLEAESFRLVFVRFFISGQEHIE